MEAVGTGSFVVAAVGFLHFVVVVVPIFAVVLAVTLLVVLVRGSGHS
jgi:hypothetical protein